ncbi:hypothetical protein NCS57_01075600 [Fusarium keratoplasticum]|uniref:Uncharacterized protein n=1 Tax=Fusarium keratoplasticum TaxID=1328300 RepID=A0ACC0QQZ6_9HYPO|nr:hypothetical protein NCS57_01075600 [Fusarium keratoplasticum]KAI8660966.1 hypothetical protein NCS57_01075600 [Fusarium keratoplasticum]
MFLAPPGVHKTEYAWECREQLSDLRELHHARTASSGPRRDGLDIDGPSSSNSEATGEECHEMDGRLDSRTGFACPGRVQVVEAQSSSPHEPHHTIIPKEPWQKHTDNTPENVECREGKDLDGSSSTCGEEGTDPAVQRVPGGWEFGDTDETIVREGAAPLAVTPGGDLHLLPWLLWNVRRIWWWLHQDWQDFWTATHQPGEHSTTSPQSGLSIRQNQGSRGGKRRRERTESADEAERDRPSSGKSKRARRPKEPGPSWPLACPFCKKDLQQYQACVKLKLTKVRYVKQHLHRKHRDDIEDWVMFRLRLRSAPGTEEEQWYRIFDLLFPGHLPRPATPYNDCTVCKRAQPFPDTSPTEEALYVSGMFLTGESVQTLQQFLVQDSALASVAADDIRGALDRALSRVFMEQTSHQNPSIDGWQARAQQGSETDIEDSEESSNSRGFVPDREVPNSRFSDDSGVVTNEHPSSATVQSDPTPEPQGTQRGVGGAFEWEEFLNDDPSLYLEGAPEDQQLGHRIDMDCWLDEWPFTNYDQPFGESSGAQA